MATAEKHRRRSENHKPERVRKSIRSQSVWKAAKSLKARGTISNSQSMVEFRDVGVMHVVALE
jgi:hypothetical protein